MNPHEADPNGANSGGGDAGYTGDADQPSSGSSAQPGSQAESITPGVDEAERETITSGVAQTSEVADREAQQDAERQGDGTPRPR